MWHIKFFFKKKLNKQLKKRFTSILSIYWARDKKEKKIKTGFAEKFWKAEIILTVV